MRIAHKHLYIDSQYYAHFTIIMPVYKNYGVLGLHDKNFAIFKRHLYIEISQTVVD